jgi:hypothetical protein
MLNNLGYRIIYPYRAVSWFGGRQMMGRKKEERNAKIGD